jgi:predicted TIM-barrel fold metal-dependent hydrolase
MNRRQFLAAAATGALVQRATASSQWGGPVLDIHLHPRSGDATETQHLDGSGCTRAVLLPGLNSEEHCREVTAREPDRYIRFTNADPASPNAVERLRAGLKGGAVGIGELKFSGALDAPEVLHIYELAAEAGVPVLIHFQENASFSGFDRLPAVVKRFPKTRFIGHANSWWANISSANDNKSGYPEGRIQPGGLIDGLLADYPNVFGDLSANSGRNALARDPDFSAAFLERHRAKLMFGSDCGCKDGHGTGQAQGGALKGKCTAQETLTLLKKLASPALFRQIVYENGKQYYRLA